MVTGLLVVLAFILGTLYGAFFIKGEFKITKNINQIHTQKELVEYTPIEEDKEDDDEHKDENQNPETPFEALDQILSEGIDN